MDRLRNSESSDPNMHKQRRDDVLAWRFTPKLDAPDAMALLG